MSRTRGSEYFKAWRAAAERDGFRVDVEVKDREIFEPYVASYRTRIDEWVVSGYLQVVDQQLALGSIDISLAHLTRGSGKRMRARRPGEYPAAGITGTVLRKIPVGKILDQARLALLASPAVDFLDQILATASAAEKGGGDPMAVAAAAFDSSRLADVEEMATEPKRSGRPARSDDEFQRIARQYLELQIAHGARGLLERLGAAQDPPKTRETMRDIVRAATKKQFLSPATRGRGGRGPGPRLLSKETR